MRYALLCGLLLACATPRALYEQTFDAHSRTLKVYQGFATSIILRGTYLSSGFREEMANERRRLLGATDSQHAEFRERMRTDLAAYHEVVFSANTPRFPHMSFGDGERGWDVRLVADGKQERLIEAYRVRNPTALHQAIYPHYNIWADLWIARFEKTIPNPRDVEFHVGSGLGNGSIRWSFEDGQVTRTTR